MAMEKMLNVQVEAEEMLLTLSCAAFYVKDKTTDPVMMDLAKKINGVSNAVGTAFWEQICEYGCKCGECDPEKNGKDCPLRKEKEADNDEQKGN